MEIEWALTGCSLLLYSLLRLQGKSIRMPTASPPYDNMTEESAFDNPVYESGVSTDVMSMQDVDSQNTSVLSWSLPIWPSSCCHLTLHQQRAPYISSHLCSNPHQERVLFTDTAAHKNIKKSPFPSPLCVVETSSVILDLHYIIHIGESLCCFLPMS